MNEDLIYQIIRYYAPHVDKTGFVVKTGLTLKEAKEHCNDPSTSTDEYFDGYLRE